jgi:hypothetical protein
VAHNANTAARETHSKSVLRLVFQTPPHAEQQSVRDLGIITTDSCSDHPSDFSAMRSGPQRTLTKFPHPRHSKAQPTHQSRFVGCELREAALAPLPVREVAARRRQQRRVRQTPAGGAPHGGWRLHASLRRRPRAARRWRRTHQTCSHHTPPLCVSEWSCREAAGGIPEAAREPSLIYPAGRVSTPADPNIPPGSRERESSWYGLRGGHKVQGQSHDLKTLSGAGGARTRPARTIPPPLSNLV